MTAITTDLTPPTRNLVLYRGDTVVLPYRLGYLEDAEDEDSFVAYDLTGKPVVAMIRAKQDDEEPMAEFEVELAAPQTGDTKGVVTLTLPASVAQDLIATSATKTWFWDAQITWGVEDDQTFDHGTVSVGKDTTRAS